MTSPGRLVVMVNTSASQVGRVRTGAYETLKCVLASLSPGDCISLIAYDLGPIPMTPGFVTPRGPEIGSALARLERREPLGASDIGKALMAAAAEFGELAVAGRALVIIRDGKSKANPLGVESLNHVLDALTVNRISAICFTIGSEIDRQVLGIPASQTGGVIFDAGKFPSETAGADLTAAAHATVFWPKAVR
jgi:hypothetical protein